MEKRKFGEKSRERGERGRDRDRDRDRDFGGPRKRAPRFVLPADAKIDYKNLALIEKFVTDSGKIMSRRITGATTSQNRQIEIAVKRARYLSLLSSGHSRRS